MVTTNTMNTGESLYNMLTTLEKAGDKEALANWVVDELTDGERKLLFEHVKKVRKALHKNWHIQTFTHL